MATNDVLSIVKARLRLNDSLDALIPSYVDEVEQRIKHYCNIRTVPDELNYVWASIVQHLVYYVQGNYDGNLSSSPSMVKVGDTQFSGNQANKIISPSVSNKMIDEVILNYKADLNHYRKLRW